MQEKDIVATGTGPSRRAVARAAAWSVPVILMAAPAPAYAASGGGAPGGVTLASVVGSCSGTGPNGTITVTLPNLPVGSQVLIALTNSGQGGFSATPDFTPTSQSGTTYVITGAGADFTGSFAIAFTLNPNQQGTVTATVTAISGVTVLGDTTGFVTKRRDGHSNSYNQCSAG
ncbi:hypothetical protein [Agromyces sp. GXS1127]|uniref:hypothetical protein n=1 Tax=Agromyces sp. GXS1127 TaxID=3424181 RepID=UPI003D314668